MIIVEKKYIAYKGVFEGKIRKRMSIEPREMTNADDLVEIFKNKLPDEEEGILKIYQRDLISGSLTFVKKIMIFNDLFITREESNREE